MRINRIKYKNYRCFLDAEVVFETSAEKNIALLVGPNGAGKTEMLFSFWWVLYGFDFSQLQNKDAAPYALNSDLHRKLENGCCSLQLQDVPVFRLRSQDHYYPRRI